MGVKRPRCFFDITIGGIPVGRVVMQLFNDVCPKTVENFRALCTGEKGIGKTTGKPLHYQGTTFHRVVKDFMVQSGDFSDGNGKGGESIYSGQFADENFDLKHDAPFLLSMANKGPNTNGSQFFVLTQPAPHLDGIHTVFGHVISGKEVIKEIEELQVDKKNRPLQDARIVNCGELVPKKKKEESSEEDSSSSSDEEEKLRKKLKKEKKKAKKAARKAEKEEGELEDQASHPLIQLSNIDPDTIPDIPNNRFLDRNPGHREERRDDRDKGASKVVGGKKVKGRGTMMYRPATKSRSRSRSRGDRRRERRGRERSMTPPHWKQAERRTVSLAEFEKNKKEAAKREEEREKREEERRERHQKRKEEEERRNMERELKKAAEIEKRVKDEELRKERKFREEKRSEMEGMDYDKLDFDPEEGEDDETVLRLRALETQARNLIPNYGSPPKPRTSSEDSSHQPSTSKAGRGLVGDSDSSDDGGDRDVRRRRKTRSPSPSPLKKKDTRAKSKSRSRSRPRRRRSSRRSRSRSVKKSRRSRRSRTRSRSRSKPRNSRRSRSRRSRTPKRKNSRSRSRKSRRRSKSDSSRSRSRSRRGRRSRSRSRSRRR